jgi:ribosome biogenesis protein MAK21
VTISPDAIARAQERARQLLSQETAVYNAQHLPLSVSDRSFYMSMLRNGTLRDRISTLAVLVDVSPLHATRALNALLAMARKHNRNESVQAVEAIVGLMNETLLPDRKLRHLSDQPLTNSSVTPAHMIMWAFEDYLKTYYFELLKIIEVIMNG